MSDSLYRANILDHYEHPRQYGMLAHPTHTAEGANLSCGDELTITAVITKDRITDINFTARACVICTTSASMLVESLKDQPITAIDKLDNETVTENLGIPLNPVRLKCALLPLLTIKNLERVSTSPAAELVD